MTKPKRYRVATRAPVSMTEIRFLAAQTWAFREGWIARGEAGRDAEREYKERMKTFTRNVQAMRKKDTFTDG